MNKLFDLRFVIGVFFLLVGIILLGYGLFASQPAAVNKWCGAIFMVFGIFMLLLSVRKPSE